MVQQCSQQRPVQNSEVYVLRRVPSFPSFPPPSPPSPITPAEDYGLAPIEALSLTQPNIAVCDKKLAVEERLSHAVHVLATEATALQQVTQLYSSDRLARDAFSRAVEAIVRRQQQQQQGGIGGKLVIIGVGKSGHIAKKLVATFNSLAVQAVFLHPTEALHGDLGQLSPRHDTILFITFSGKTPELLALLPHLDHATPLILLTGNNCPNANSTDACELVRQRPDTILLPAPVHEAETASFGVAAPTTSTTVALAVGDALALVAARELHAGAEAQVFARNHPGGAIGATLWRRSKPREDVKAVMVPLDEVGRVGVVGGKLEEGVTGLDVLRAGYASASGWVRVDEKSAQRQQSATGSGWRVVSPRRIKRLGAEDMACPVDEILWLVTPRSEFIPVAADASVARAAEWIRGLRAATATTGGKDGFETGPYGDDAVVAVMEKGECVGLLEVGKLLEEA